MDNKIEIVITKLDNINNRLEKFDSRLENIDSRLSASEQQLAVYNEQLKTHIEGTVQNREALKLFENRFSLELRPIQKHITMLEGVFKFIGVVCILIGAVAGMVRIFG